MAPEIILGHQYDAKVDVWAIGCIAHIMLTGNAPFWGKTQNDVYKAIVSKTPTFGKARKVLSQEAIEFTMNCLQKDQNVRSTAEQLLNHPWLQGNAEEHEIDDELLDEIFSDMSTFKN